MSTEQHPVTPGAIVGLIFDAAIGLADAEAQVRRDMKLLEAMILTDGREHMTFEEAVDYIRSTPGHPKLPLIDIYESPRLAAGAPRTELRQAEALLARMELQGEHDDTFENLAKRALAGIRLRNIRRMYGGEEIFRARSMRARGSASVTPNHAESAPTMLTSAELAGLSGDVHALLLDVWEGDIDLNAAVERLRDIATEQEPPHPDLILLLKLMQGKDGQKMANRLAARLRRIRHDGDATSASPRSPAPDGVALPAEEIWVDLEPQVPDSVMPYPSQAPSPELTTPALVTVARDSPATQAAVAELIDWLDRYKKYVLPKFVEENGVLRFPEEPRQAKVLAAYKLAGEHPQFQAEVRRLKGDNAPGQ